MAHYPIPHTDEWFEKLELFNPMQAAITRKVIELAGGSEVCSVCGNSPASDFKVAGNVHPDAVATIRLCSDCKTIREGQEGETFESYWTH